MKFFKITYLLIPVLLIGISCDVDNTAMDYHNARTLEVDYNAQTEDGSGEAKEVPSSDSWIMLAFNDSEVNWKDVEHWYTNKLPGMAKKPEYHNLKSLAISCLVTSKTAFLKEAEKEKLLFYAKEIIYDEKVVNNIGVVAKLLESAKTSNFFDKEVAQHAYFANKKYAEKYKTELNDYRAKYAEVYKLIDLLQHDRWGNRLYTEGE